MLRLLDPKQNPTLRHTEALPLLARDAYGRVVGRLLVHVNHRHNVRHGERVAFFGFFECIDDADVARALLDAAAAFGRRYGCARLRGPFGLTMMQELGSLCDGFDLPPAFDETYTAPYYSALFAEAALQQAMHVTSFRLAPIKDAVVRAGEDRSRSSAWDGFRLRIRQPDDASIDRDIEIARDILNDAFYAGIRTSSRSRRMRGTFRLMRYDG